MTTSEEASPSKADRMFTVAFAISAAAHGVLLVTQLLPAVRMKLLGGARPFEVVYDYALGERDDVHRMQRHVAEATRTTLTASSLGTGALPALSIAAGEGTQVRIPERPIGGALGASFALTPVARSAVVDLTNLAEASGGNPVLLTYFSVVREQIQQAANHRSWISDDTQQGLVYVSFLLAADGTVEQTAILGDRSVTSAALRQIALRIVEAAAPFPAFPPSIKERSKTVVVPLQFLEGT